MIKLGLYLATQFTPETNVAAQIGALVDQTKRAQTLGYASLWAAHHYLTGPLQMIQPMPLLAYLLPHAKGMLIGPNILILPLLNPVHVAEDAATMDVLSGGNYVIGVGLGYREAEFKAFDVPLKTRVGRFNESLHVMRRLFTEERVTHKGQFFDIEDLSLGLKPLRPGGPPVWIAAVVENAIKRAAEVGDAWLITFYPTLASLAGQMTLYRDTLKAVGKPLPADMPVLRECYVDTSHKAALENCRGPLQYKYQAYASWGQDRILSPEDRFDQPFDAFVKDRFIIGDKAFVREELQRYKETLGVNHFIMRVQWPGLEPAKVLRSIEALAEAARDVR